MTSLQGFIIRPALVFGVGLGLILGFCGPLAAIPHSTDVGVSELIGTSTQGRAITATRYGSEPATTRVVVVGQKRCGRKKSKRASLSRVSRRRERWDGLHAGKCTRGGRRRAAQRRARPLKRSTCFRRANKKKAGPSGDSRARVVTREARNRGASNTQRSPHLRSSGPSAGGCGRRGRARQAGRFG